MVYVKTFYAVGQGGFYSERIFNEDHEKTIVYDCGSVTKATNNQMAPLNRCINESGLERIDYVVISHLDEDHINGLSELEKYEKSIEPNWNPVIILPKPNPMDLLLFYMTASRSAIKYYLGSMPSMRQLHVTDENGKNDVFDLDAEWNGVQAVSHNCRVFTGFKKCKEKWLLKFYVNASIYQKKLTKRDVQIINSVKSFSDFKEKKKILDGIYKATKEKLRKLKKIRKKLGLQSKGDSSEMNLSSMAMISAPQKKSFRETNCKRENEAPFISWLNGDIRLKNEKEMLAIENHFKEFLSQNIDFQIPHHGSHNNYCRLPKGNKIRAYLWAGTENDYGHPSGTVLRKIKKENVELNWITEEDDNIIRQEIWI